MKRAISLFLICCIFDFACFVIPFNTVQGGTVYSGTAPAIASETVFTDPELRMVDASVTVISSRELGENQDAWIAFNTLPGNTVVLLALSCKCGIDNISPHADIAFREALMKSVKYTLRNVRDMGIAPSKAFRDALVGGVKRSCHECIVNGKTFDLAAEALQCQYQIQHVAQGQVGFNSAHSKGADYHVFVTVFFSRERRSNFFATDDKLNPVSWARVSAHEFSDSGSDHFPVSEY
jgi:hypothetical protein